MSVAEETRPAGKFAIYRGAEAPAFSEIGVMEYDGVTPELQQTFMKLGEAGIQEGDTVKLLFAAPGFSLTYAWFKSGYPLPRHSHNADCLYYIIAGSLTREYLQHEANQALLKFAESDNTSTVIVPAGMNISPLINTPSTVKAPAQ